MPPIAEMSDFANEYDQTQPVFDQEDHRNLHSNLYARGYDWETIPENIQKLFAMKNYALKNPVHIEPFSWMNADLDNGVDSWEDRWDEMPRGEHQVMKRNGFPTHHISLHPMRSAFDAQDTLWHELGHAFQHDEGREGPWWEQRRYEREGDKYRDEYMAMPHEREADEMARFMRDNPLVRRVQPEVNPRWFDSDFHQEYGRWNEAEGDMITPDDTMHQAVAKWRKGAPS